MGYERHHEAQSGTRYLKGMLFVSTIWRPAERGKLLDGLLAPLRLPERVIEALDSLVETVQELGPMRAELTQLREHVEPLADLPPVAERIGSQAALLSEVLSVTQRIEERAEPLGELLPALESLELSLGARVDSLRDVVGGLQTEQSRLNERVEELVRELATIDETISALRGDVELISDRLPNTSGGPLEKAREMLAGSGH
jgi:chromosome segregation ATPase